MKILADFHNVVSHSPAYFKRLAETDDLYILTGCQPIEHIREKIIPSYLKFMNVKKIFFKKDIKDKNNYFESKTWKIKKVLSLKPDVYYDDDNLVCQAVKSINKGIVVNNIIPIMKPICWHKWDTPGHCKVCKRYFQWAKN